MVRLAELLGQSWRRKSLPSPFYCSFSGHTKLGSSSAAETMTSLHHAVWAMELLLPTQLVRSEHCNACGSCARGYSITQDTVERSFTAVTKSTASAYSLHNRGANPANPLLYKSPGDRTSICCSWRISIPFILGGCRDRYKGPPT